MRGNQFVATDGTIRTKSTETDFSNDFTKYTAMETFSIDEMSEEELSSYVDTLVAVYGFTDEEI